jgi:predicted 2-oxoglutarate/Fe(II)-dependent dioxygenase YbiX
MSAATRLESTVGVLTREGIRLRVDKEHRHSSHALVAEATALDMVERIASLAPVISAHFNVLVAECEKIQFLCYERAGWIEPHSDNAGDPRLSDFWRRRRISLVLFVNDCADAMPEENATDHPPTYCGGYLRLFRDGPNSSVWSLAGQRGLLVAFRSATWHQVTPVTAGTRYSVVTWLLEPAMPTSPTPESRSHSLPDGTISNAVVEPIRRGGVPRSAWSVNATPGG